MTATPAQSAQPSLLVPTMVWHTTMPYADARARALREDRMLGAAAAALLAMLGGGLWWVMRH